MTIEKIIDEIRKDITNLKLKSFQPDKKSAKVFLEFFSWDESNSKQNFRTLYVKELQILNEWLEIYCNEHKCTKEEALERIIDGAI